MQEPFDAKALMTRVSLIAKELRKSEMYPAIIGGVAGGIAGALIAAIIAGGKSNRTAQPAAPTATPSAKAGINLSMKDLMQLIPLVTALAKQVQGWAQKSDKK